jgi:hypothetical protein
MYKRVVGHYLCNEWNQAIASAEIVKFQMMGGVEIPAEVRFQWYEEKTSMIWSIVDVRVNELNRKDCFNLPQMRHMVDMSRMSEGS